MAKVNPEVTEQRDALARIRAAVGQALGLGADVALTPAQLATAVERLAAAAAATPGAALLARDLE